MKYPVWIIVLLCLFFMACSRKEKETVLTSKDIQARTDSIVAEKTAEINRQVAEDLDRRMSIEVKAKADSIVQVWQNKHTSDNPQ
ncbi:MAG: hypothetical protein BGO69_04470 [Bacteroidetes bacterium 46-16]|nr:MAG: hypothetical protein BGO69_04470 [Bacteroidetes bacterium 46-16]